MNDHTLASLINLFALFVSASESDEKDKEHAREVVINYLQSFFGIHNYENYIGIYDNLTDVYDLTEPDLDETVAKIVSQLKGRIGAEDQLMLMLRFMEFAFINGTIDSNERKMITILGKEFCIGDDVMDEAYNFITSQKSDNVGIATFKDLSGSLRVLRLKDFNKVVVAYDGDESVKMNEMPFVKGLFMTWPENGIIKSAKSKPIYYRFVSRLLGEDDRYQAIAIEGRNVNFRFPNSDNGLHNFTFALRSGEFVAIMGGSGVGKSTLLSILNGTLQPDSGTLTINGLSLYDNLEQLRKYIGFVPQDDLLIAELTVYQNLFYTTKFCFADLTDEQIDERVNKTLDDLGLSYIKDLKVGSPLNKTISGGQRKRLNIALELIREPAILFLDEPTSGLSSSDSEKVVHLLKEQTYRGKLVIVNIHQPSSDIYKLFDRLWLLDKGGYPIFDGNPILAPVYFKQEANYADADSSMCQECGNINPEIMLNIIDENRLDSSGRQTSARRIQPEEWHEKYLAKVAERKEFKEEPKEIALPKTEQKHPGYLEQFFIYLKRNIKAKLTDRQFITIALLEAPALALIVAFLTRYAGDKGYTVFDNKNLLSYFFMAIIVATFMGMSICAEEIFKDRALLKRERFLQLSHGAYISSKIVQTAMVSVIQTGLFILVGNNLLGLSDLWMEWWLIMFVTAFLAGLTGLLLSQSLNSVVAIYITIPLLLIPQILLCGLVVSFDDINQHSKTRNVPLVGDLIPSRWAYEALAVTAFTENDYTKNFFVEEAAQYEYQLDRMGFLSTMKKKALAADISKLANEKEYIQDLPMLRHEIKRLTEKWDLSVFTDLDKLTEKGFSHEVYQNLENWIAESDKSLYKRSLIHTREVDYLKMQIINEKGSQYLMDLQTNHCNKNLQNTLANTNADELVKQEGDCLVPYAGTIYLAPTDHFGRAPFYSSRKMIGYGVVPTIWYNLSVMMIMAAIVALLLYTNFPWRKEQ